MNAPSYILRNKLTNRYFDGTNFSAENLADATPLTSIPHPAALRDTWGENAEVIPMRVLRNTATGEYLNDTETEGSIEAATVLYQTGPDKWESLGYAEARRARSLDRSSAKQPPAKTIFRKVYTGRSGAADYVADLPSGAHIYISVVRKQSGDGVYSLRKNWSSWSTFLHGKAIYGQGGINSAKRQLLKADAAHKSQSTLSHA